jgi:hypothetical protein
MSRRGRRKRRSGDGEDSASWIDVAKWEAERRRWLLRRIGGVVLFPAIVSYILYHDAALKGHADGPTALSLTGFIMLLCSLALRWQWWYDSSVDVAPPARVAIKDAPTGERVLVNGSVVHLDSTVVGPISGRQGVQCRLTIQVESNNPKAPPWIPRHTREWSSMFLLEDDLGGSLLLDGRNVDINTALSSITIVHASKTGVSGLPDEIQRYIQKNKVSLRETEQNIRVLESVLGEGDEVTIIGRLTAPSHQEPSLYRAVEPKPSELTGVELMMPISLDDLRRMSADSAERSKLLNAGIVTGLGLLVAGVLMGRG